MGNHYTCGIQSDKLSTRQLESAYSDSEVFKEVCMIPESDRISKGTTNIKLDNAIGITRNRSVGWIVKQFTRYGLTLNLFPDSNSFRLSNWVASVSLEVDVCGSSCQIHWWADVHIHKWGRCRYTGVESDNNLKSPYIVIPVGAKYI